MFSQMLQLLLLRLYGAWPESPDFFRHLFRDRHKPGALSGREIIHLEPVALKADAGEDILDPPDPFPGPYVSHHKVAVSFFTSPQIHAVGACLEGPEQMDDVHFPGAGDPDDSDIRGILSPNRPCQ